MSTLTQQPNPRSSSMSQQRPSHVPSKNLSQNEIQCLYDLLGNDCVTLATAVVQILYGCNNVWKKQACGVLCFIKDYSRRGYCFRLYNLRAREAIFEEKISASLRLKKSSDLFYTFDGMKCKVGISFVDCNEAERFCKQFHEKQENLEKKIIKGQKSINTHQTSMSALMNGIKPPSNNTVKTPIPTSVSEKKVKPKTIASRKKNTRRLLTISEPIRGSFVHDMHVGHEQSFVTVETQKNLFEQVLTRMHMSKDEESYVRNAIQNTDHGFDKLFTKSTHDDDVQKQQITDYPPEIPPRTYLPLERNKTPPQLQNTSNTSNDFEQSTAPVVPPRPARRVPNNIEQSIKTSRVPPPPIPTNLQNQTSNLSVPPPPPLPPPAPTFLPEQIKNESSTSSSNSEQNSLLKEISDFNTVRLKPTSQRPTTIVKAPENKSNLDTQQTIEENIRVLLQIRRKEIMPDNNDNDQNDSSDDEWDA